MWAFLDWGFRPEDLTQHVEVFHGRDDEILSPEMGRTLADRLPDSAFHLLDGGHYTIFASWVEVLNGSRVAVEAAADGPARTDGRSGPPR